MKTMITAAYRCCRFIIPVLLTCGCNTKSTPHSSSLSFPAKYRIVVQRPPAAAPATEDNTSSYTAMLKKGYAYIGSISSTSGVRNLSENKLKSQLLKESGRMGAAKAWVKTHPGVQYKSSFSSGGTYTSYSPGSSSYMKYGTSGSTTTVTYRPSSHLKKIKVVWGSADLFYYDPAFAEKQLNDAQKKWDQRIAAINEKRPLLLAKLGKIKSRLEAYSTYPVHNKIVDYLRNHISTLTYLIDVFQTGMTSDSYGNKIKIDINYWNGKSYFQTLDDLILETGPLYKELRTGERGEMIMLVGDVKRIVNHDWEVVCDFYTPTLAEKLLF